MLLCATVSTLVASEPPAPFLRKRVATTSVEPVDYTTRREAGESAAPLHGVAGAGDAPLPADARTPIRRTGVSAPRTGDTRGAEPTGLFSTLVIMGGMLLGLWLLSRSLKKWMSQRFVGLPKDVIDLLGVQPVAPQQSIHLVRVGERLLVIAAGPQGMQTLSEITDPAEVQHLTLLCRSGSPEAASGHRSHHTGHSRTDTNHGNWLTRLTSRNSEATTAEPATVSTPQVRSLGTPEAAVVPLETVDDGDLFVRRSTHRVAGLLLLALLCPSTATAQLPSDQGAAAARPPFSKLPANRDAAPRSSVWLEDSHVESTLPATSTSAIPAGTAIAAATPLDSLTPESVGSSLKLMLLVGVMSLAPAILLMTTCYIRIIVVLGILRQALGVPQFPPTQVLTSLSLFLTAAVMWPVWEAAYREGIEPYSQGQYATSPQQHAAFQTALIATVRPVRSFMSRQIEATNNAAAIDLLLNYGTSADSAAPAPEYYEEVPLRVLLPAYVLSELKTAFLIGFQIYLPFVVIDLVVTSILTSLGLTMLPPNLVSLPLKLLLFILIDGWYLTVELLMNSVAPI
ncbi:MAG: flagellar biosynthetic protein FliO [Planctomycetaceae bacterium]